MQLSLYSHIYIDLGNKDSWDPVIFKGSYTDNRFVLELADHSRSLLSYRGNEKELETVLKSLLSHFALVFNPTIRFTFSKGCSQELMMSVIYHMKHVNRATSVNIGKVSISPENFQYILEELRGTEIPLLAIKCEMAPDFQYRTVPGRFFKVDQLFVDNGHWMHMEDFTNCKMVTVNIEKHLHPKISEMLRSFIKKWIDSGDWRLKQLEFCSFIAPINLREVLQGVHYRSVIIRSFFQFRKGFFRTVELNEQFEAIEITRRSDGKKATVTCSQILFVFKNRDLE